MRMLLRAVMPTEPANAMVKNGTLGSTIQKILADLKPEAAYFVATDSGERCAVIVFDMKQNTLVNFLCGYRLPFQNPPTSLSSAES